MPTPVERLGVGLRPRTPEVEAIVARRITELAAEVGDLDLVDAIADEVEHPSAGGLPSAEVADRAGITRRQLSTWTTSGYLTPLPRPGGSGYPAYYGTDAVLKARLMGSLVNMLHQSPGAASETAEEILATGRAQVGPFVVTRRSLA
jgi:hypothetical protein